MNRHKTASNNHFSRRESISRMGSGFGGMALSALLGDFDRTASAAEGVNHNVLARSPHHQPRALAVIQIFMHGGPSQIVNRTQTADLHAAILHQLGLDHKQLTFNHNSRDERLTDVYKARVIEQLLG